MCEWEQVTRLCRGGHRVFKTDEKPGWYAIADASGSTPDRTDDGVLWVDAPHIRKEGVKATLRESRFILDVPLLRENGESTFTTMNLEATYRLLALLGLPCEVIVGTEHTVSKLTLEEPDDCGQ